MKANSHLTNFLRLIYASSLLLLVSCATTPSHFSQQEEREKFLTSATSVSFQARVVLKQKGSVYHFNLHWQQQGNNFKAQGFDFLGRQVFQIEGDQRQALFRQNQAEQLQPSNVIIKQQLGIDADPKTLLRLLLATDGQKFTIKRNKGLLQEQSSGDLRLAYLRYEEIEPYPMPSAITITTSDIMLKLALHSWIIQ